jgi:NAD+ kinase
MAAAPVRLTSVGIVAKSHLIDASTHLAEIEAWLADRGVAAVFETATAALMPASDARRVAGKRALIEEVGMVLVLGGDGTLLSMADYIGAAGLDIPILGVNFGSLGFLTEVTLPELYPSLERALAGTAVVEERLMLRSTPVRGGRGLADHVTLNDVVVAKSGRARMLDLSVFVGDEFVTRVRADGVIVATPTGSTAYTLSSGGPIVQPNVEALLVTPIAPHTLTNRPLVVPASSSIRVQPHLADEDEVVVSFDGQAGFQLQAGDEIRIRRADTTLRLIRPTTRSYFEVLRQKLKWGER